jgi:hypothetical protein
MPENSHNPFADNLHLEGAGVLFNFAAIGVANLCDCVSSFRVPCGVVKKLTFPCVGKVMKMNKFHNELHTCQL